MILYKRNDWLEAIFRFHRGSAARVLFRRVAWAAVYVTGVVVLELNFTDFRLKDVPAGYLSTLGILLSLLLLFRTNTAYDRFYEGRRAWGTLVNTSRNLAVLLHAILPADAAEPRLYVARVIANFPFALRNHLRNEPLLNDLELTDDAEQRALEAVEHVPMRVVGQLRDRIEQLSRDGLITDAQSINLNTQMIVLLDVAGICERIRSTPIPFSYSFFIKLFVTAYIFLLPFIVVDPLGYLAIPAALITAYVMLGVETIGEEIEDPFGKERNDLPLSQLANMIRGNVHEAFGVHLPHAGRPKDNPRYLVVT